MRVRGIVPALLWLLLSGTSAPPIPDTPAGQFLRDFLSAYNSGDSGELERYNGRYQVPRPTRSWIAQHDDTGDLRPVRINADSPNKLTVLWSASDSDELYGQAVEVNAANPRHILRNAFGQTDRPAEYAIARLSHREAAIALDAKAAELVAEDRFAGTMMVERAGRILFAKAWGMADREAKLPMTMDTKLRIGSNNKMFTAVAVLQLVQTGKLSLDSTVGEYVADYPNSDLAKSVTIRQLLTHTGGAGNICGPDFDANRLTLKHNNDYVRLFGHRAPDLSVQGKDTYANYGFVLLGHIVERASGKDYYRYVQEHIFQPAGMSDTGSLPEDTPVTQRAKGYTRTSGSLVSNAGTLPYRGTAAGGGYTTGRDMIRFADALRGGRLLSRALLDQATSPQNPKKWYGFGFAMQGSGIGRFWGHSGGAPGMNAAFRIYPDTNTIIVVLSNLDPSGADKLATFYANRMPAK